MARWHGFAAVAALVAAPLVAAAPAGQWIGAFQAPPIGYEPEIKDALGHTLNNETVRQPIRVDASGTALRVRFTNELNQDPLTIGPATIVRLDGVGRPLAGTMRPLLFNGKTSVTIPAGAPYLSDPVAGTIEAGADYAVSVHYPRASKPPAHAQMAEIAPGDQTGRAALSRAVTARASGLVSEVDVMSPRPRPVLVAFGDSITEGAASTAGAHMSWPDQLGRLLARSRRGRCWSVVNSGISGNRLLHDGRGPNAVARFDRDVLSVPGVREIVLLEGINDIGAAAMPTHRDQVVSVDEIIGAYREIIARAHAHRIRVLGGTLTPYQGAGYYDETGEMKREAVNRWIRTSGAFDGVIDFEAAMRDPLNPERFIEADQSGDHLHPNDRGYAVMAAAAEPAILKEGCPAH